MTTTHAPHSARPCPECSLLMVGPGQVCSACAGRRLDELVAAARDVVIPAGGRVRSGAAALAPDAFDHWAPDVEP